jgi:NADP-dependent 3-hydroxy acid dehydrogenase YdfG
MLDIHTPVNGSGFKGLHVLVSGGTTGIGRAIALQMAQKEARVFIFGRHERELRDALDAARDCPGEVTGMTADHADPGDVQKVFAQVDRRFPHLDVLVNNAAIGSEDLMDDDEGTIEYTVRSNVCGYFYCTRHAIFRMKQRKAGHIINIGSVTREKLKAGGEVYTATKAAIHALSESIRKSVHECGIKVTLVEPGKTGSDMVEESLEEQREMEAKLEMMTAEDVAEVVCYCLTQSRRAVITTLQIEPFRRQ